MCGRSSRRCRSSYSPSSLLRERRAHHGHGMLLSRRRLFSLTAAPQIGDRRSEDIYRQIANAATDVLPSGYIRFIPARLNTDDMPDVVEQPSLSVSSRTVERALEDADNLLASG